MINLFETATIVKFICQQTKTGMFREFWTEDLKSSLFEVIEANLRESEETEQLLGTVKQKLAGFLQQVKDKLNQFNATYQEKKQFYSHLVNLIFSNLGAGIEGPQLGGPITRVRTEFPREYEKGDQKQAAFVRRQYERMKDIFTKQNNPDPHAAAIEYIKNTWKGISDNLIRTLGKEPRVRTPKPVTNPVVAPESPQEAPRSSATPASLGKPAPEEPDTAEEPAKEVDPRNPALGKHKMTMDEIIKDAQEHLDLIKNSVRSKTEQKKAIKRYLGTKHFDKALSRDPLIGHIIDRMFDTDRLEGKSNEEQDKEKAKTYLSVMKAARSAVSGARNPSLTKMVEGIDDMIQSAAWQEKGYLRLIVTPGDIDYEGLLALARTRIREAGYDVGITAKDDMGEGQPEAYKIYFSKPDKKKK